MYYIFTGRRAVRVVCESAMLSLPKNALYLLFASLAAAATSILLFTNSIKKYGTQIIQAMEKVNAGKTEGPIFDQVRVRIAAPGKGRFGCCGFA